MSSKMHIVAFGASTSTSSINAQFAAHVLAQFKGAEGHMLDLNDFPLPLFSIDLEKNGYPETALLFIQHIQQAELIICSLAEHNSNFTAAFKNLLDWCSRIDKNLYSGKKLLLLSTSPGKRGGANVLAIGESLFTRWGANVVGTFSLPEFHVNFSENQIKHTELREQLAQLIVSIQTP